MKKRVKKSYLAVLLYDTGSQTLGREPFVGHGNICMGLLFFCFLHFVFKKARIAKEKSFDLVLIDENVSFFWNVF